VLSPQLPERHLTLIWFWSVLLGGLQPSSKVPPALSDRPLWLGPSDPLAILLGDPCCRRGWLLTHITHGPLKIYLVALITFFMVLQLNVSPYFTCCDCVFHDGSLITDINSYIILSTDEKILPLLIISYIPAMVKSILPVITTKQVESHFWLVFGRYSALMSAMY